MTHNSRMLTRGGRNPLTPKNMKNFTTVRMLPAFVNDVNQLAGAVAQENKIQRRTWRWNVRPSVADQLMHLLTWAANSSGAMSLLHATYRMRAAVELTPEFVFFTILLLPFQLHFTLKKIPFNLNALNILLKFCIF